MTDQKPDPQNPTQTPEELAHEFLNSLKLWNSVPLDDIHETVARANADRKALADLIRASRPAPSERKAAPDFEKFLRNKHTELRPCLDDEQAEDFEEWLGLMDADTWIEYAIEFAAIRAERREL